jgi:hypothetical protein
VQDREEYWQKLGEEKRKQLKIKPRLSATVDYGRY